MTKAYPITTGPAMAPTHPGEILKEDVLPALKLSVSEAARQLGVSRQTLHRIMAQTHGVTPEMAVRLGQFYGNGPDIWLAMQSAHDLWRAKLRMQDEVAKIPSHAGAG